MSVRREKRRDPVTGAERQFWIVDMVFQHADGRSERVRKVSPVPTKRGAEAFERQLRATLQNPALQPKEVPTFTTFVEERWWPTYPAAAGNRHTTVREKGFHLECHLKPFFGGDRLDEIKIERLERFLATLIREKGLSAKRAKNILATLRRILVSAVEWEVLAALPNFPKVRVTQGPSDYLQREESDRLLSATRNPEERALLMFALHTGARAGEQIRARWFVGLPLDQDAWDHSSFSRARDNFLLTEFAVLFFERHVEMLRREGFVSSDHLSVDGSLLSAWASHKSLVSKDDLDDDGKPPPPPPGGRNAWVDFKGQKRSNETHVSATDPDAKLASKGLGAKLSHELHVVMENRNGLPIDFTISAPTGTSEREQAKLLIAGLVAKGLKPETVGADRKYSDGDDLVVACAEMDVTPHFSVRDDRPHALARLFHDGEGYAISTRCRMRIEEIFGFLKTVTGLAKLKVRGHVRVWGVVAIALAALSLTRHAKLVAHA